MSLLAWLGPVPDRYSAPMLMNQLVLEFEVEDGDSELENSLLDHLTEGLVTCQCRSYLPLPIIKRS
jgi:hypothetical protein